MKISIGIPFFNAEPYLADAIKSVIQQSFEDWELILVNDGSSDSSLKIAESFAKKDNRIRVISDGLNKKLPYRLNQIIDESKGEVIEIIPDCKNVIRLKPTSTRSEGLYYRIWIKTNCNLMGISVQDNAEKKANLTRNNG